MKNGYRQFLLSSGEMIWIQIALKCQIQFKSQQNRSTHRTAFLFCPNGSILKPTKNFFDPFSRFTGQTQNQEASEWISSMRKINENYLNGGFQKSESILTQWDILQLHVALAGGNQSINHAL